MTSRTEKFRNPDAPPGYVRKTPVIILKRKRDPIDDICDEFVQIFEDSGILDVPDSTIYNDLIIETSDEEEESASSTSKELSDIKESPELSDVKESNSESAMSVKEVVASGPSSHSNQSVDSEHQSEIISSTTQDLSDKLALNESILSASSAGTTQDHEKKE